MENLKQKIVEFAKKTPKSKFYFSDMLTGVKKLDPTATASTVKKAASDLVAEGVLEYYSTGSTTLYGLKGRGMSPERSGITEEDPANDLVDDLIDIAVIGGILSTLDDSPVDTPMEGGGGEFGGGGASGDWGDSDGDSGGGD
jgi:uncharacterized membrane protein YgcG